MIILKIIVFLKIAFHIFSQLTNIIMNNTLAISVICMKTIKRSRICCTHFGDCTSYFECSDEYIPSNLLAKVNSLTKESGKGITEA